MSDRQIKWLLLRTQLALAQRPRPSESVLVSPDLIRGIQDPELIAWELYSDDVELYSDDASVASFEHTMLSFCLYDLLKEQSLVIYCKGSYDL